MADFEILALDTVAPQIRAPGAADGYAVPRNMTMGASRQFFSASGTVGAPGISVSGNATTGLYFPAANTIGFVCNGTERGRFDSNGSLGMSVAPSPWASTSRAVDFSFPSFGMDTAGQAIVGFNAYNSAGTTWNYKSADEAALFTIDNAGGFTWRQAALGTAGAAITFTQAMTLDSSGRLGVGFANPDVRLRVQDSNPARGIIATINNSAGTGQTGSQLQISQAGIADWAIGQPAGVSAIAFWSGRSPAGDGTERARIDSLGNVVINTAALATTATDGFLYIPTCAGAPTGVPTTYTGRSPLVVDTTNNRFYIYAGGAWRYAALV